MYTKSARMVLSALVLVSVIHRPAWTQQEETFEPFSTSCFSTHTSGSGTSRMSICISNHGNLVRFQSPGTINHMGTDSVGDGYSLCRENGAFVLGYDAGFSEDGFGPPTISQPNGPNTFPLTITRNDIFGGAGLRLTQTFSRDTTEKDVTITMTLTNLSAASMPDIVLVRYFDGDIGGTAGGDRWARSADSVWGWEDGSGHGLMLTALSPGVAHLTAVQTFAVWQSEAHQDCSGFGNSVTPTAPGNFVGRLTYLMGSFNPGQSKTVSVLYRRF
jgi:hypothetical protein